MTTAEAGEATSNAAATEKSISFVVRKVNSVGRELDPKYYNKLNLDRHSYLTRGGHAKPRPSLEAAG